MSDHPFIRRSFNCPICGGVKRSDHIACGDCYRSIWDYGSQSEIEDAEDRLDDAEHALMEAEEAAMQASIAKATGAA